MDALLKNKNFVTLLSGRLITNIGDSMYYITAMWLVYKLGGSAFYSGLAGLLTLLPQTLQFAVGPIVDRKSIKKILIFSQIMQAALLCLIPVAYLIGRLSVILILVVMPIVSFLDQFSFPAENALIPRILPTKDRVKANSAMTVAYQGTDGAFNAIGGVLVAMAGAVTLYSADVATFLVAALLFSRLSLTKKGQDVSGSTFSQQTRDYFSDLKEGFHIVFHSVLGKMIVTGFITNFALGALMASLPAYADTLGGAKTYGFLLAGMAIGSLAGAMSANFFERLAIGKLMMISYFIGFCCWLAAALIPVYSLKLLLFSMSMIPLGLNNIIGYTMMQNVVPEQLLARSISVMTSVSTCIMPVGSLIGGTFSTLLGPMAVFTSASFSFLFIAIYVFLMPILRKIPAPEKVKPEDYGFQTK